MDCGYQGSASEKACPRCQMPLFTTLVIRRQAWVLIGVGGILLAMMTWIIVAVALVFARSGEPGAGTRFDGSPAMAAAIFAVLGLAWLFGLICIEYGIWLLRYRKRNKRLVNVAIGLFFATMAAGFLAQLLD